MNLNQYFRIFNIILLLFGLKFTTVPLSYGQDTALLQKLNLPDTICSLDEALTIIENFIPQTFSYNSDLLPLTKKVQLSSQPESLLATLSRIINDTTINYKIIEKQIVIYNPLIADTTDFKPSVTLSEILIIKGKIIDAQSKEPVPFANIALLGKNTGTISNEEGDFVFKIHSQFQEDTLGISYLGYKTYKVPVKEIINTDKLYLFQPDYIPIQEVIIRKTDPIYIIRSAIQRIEQNYRINPNLYTSFYRESVRKNNQYVIISEAVIDIYKSSYTNEYQSDQIKILQGRKNIDTHNTDSVTLKLKGGLQSCLFLDIIKNRADFIREEFMSNYQYKMTDIIIDQDNYTYVIDFIQKEFTDPPHYQGRLYIDVNTLAIRGAEFWIISGKIQKAAGTLVLKKPRSLIVKPLSAAYSVRFTEKDNKFALNHIRCEIRFRIRQKGNLFGNTFLTVSELATTKIDTVNVKRFRSRETDRADDIFIEQIGGYDEAFWGEYNYIKPEEPLEEALIRINKILLKEEQKL